MTKPVNPGALERRLAALAMESEASGDPPTTFASGDDVLDRSYVERIRAALGPRRFAGLIDVFLIELNRRPTEIRDLLADGRWTEAQSAAHSLKGSALSVGPTALSDASAVIEEWHEEASELMASQSSTALELAADLVKPLLNALIETASAKEHA